MGYLLLYMPIGYECHANVLRYVFTAIMASYACILKFTEKSNVIEAMFMYNFILMVIILPSLFPGLMMTFCKN